MKKRAKYPSSQRRFQINTLIVLLASLTFLSIAGAVTKSGDAKTDATQEVSATEPLKIEFKTGGEPVSPDVLGSDLSGQSGTTPYLNLEPIGDQAFSQPYETDNIGHPRRSIGIFSLALWFFGLLLVFAGLFSLSFGRKLEGISAQEFVQQLRYMTLVSTKQNVSRNWGKKKDATWFVVMGLCSIAAGMVDWLFL